MTTTTESPTMTTATMTATATYVAAAAAAEVADDAYDAATCSEACAATPGNDHLADCPEGLALAARHAAHAAHDAAQEAWRASDEPRDWEVRDDQAQDILHDVAPADAEAAIEAWLTDGDWDTSEGPLHLTAYAYPIDPTTGTADGEGRACGEATIEQDAPACRRDRDHAWRTPHSVVGGLKENPGVHGRGAGIVAREVCAHCGWYRVFESARQDGSGRYHEATSYAEPDEDSLAWVARRAARLAAESAEAL